MAYLHMARQKDKLPPKCITPPNKKIDPFTNDVSSYFTHTHTHTLPLTLPYSNPDKPVSKLTLHYPTSPLVTLSHFIIPLPTTIHLSTYYYHPPPIITVTLQLPISNSTTTYPTITLPSTMSYSLYCCSTLHIETLTNNRK